MSDTPQDRRDSQNSPQQGNGSAPASGRTAPARPKASDRGSKTRSASSTGLTPVFVLRALGQWWKVATPAGIALAALALAAIWLTFKPQYESTALLRIEDKEPILLRVNAIHDNAARFARTQIELMRSPLVMEEVLSRPDIARFPEILNKDDPVRWLREVIDIRGLKGSEIYEIKLVIEHPEHAAAIVNAVADIYYQLQNSTETRRSQEIIRLLNIEKKRRELEVTRLRTNVRDLAKDITIANPHSGIGKPTFIINNPLATLQQRLIEVEVERELLAGPPRMKGNL